VVGFTGLKTVSLYRRCPVKKLEKQLACSDGWGRFKLGCEACGHPGIAPAFVVNKEADTSGETAATLTGRHSSAPIHGLPHVDIGVIPVKIGSMILAVLAMLLAGPEGNQALGEGHPRVVLQDGVLEGDQFGPPTKYAAFLGIPYAAPPVGNLRWRAPEPPASWQGVRLANKYGPACPQLPSPWLPEMLGRKQMRTDEACLYLNVWTPDLDRHAKLPVMVWVHGGGNIEGSQEWPPLGRTLATHGVVVVTINYRLGVLGFLSHPALTEESPHHASGNYGLLDQMAALRWVQQNIEQFGGDPQRVTVFGASSGSLDICDLMASPLANGLFQHAIMQSGVCVDSLAPLIAGAEAGGMRMAANLGLGNGPDALAKLRAIPADELVRKAADEKDVDFNPVVDGWVFHQQPALIFSQGDQARVPVIVGSNADEVSIFASPLVRGTSYRPKSIDEYRRWLSREFHSNADAVFAAYPARTDAQVPATFRAMDTDYQFGFGASLLAHEVSAAGQRAYLYTFTNVGTGQFAALGAFHSEESMFLSKKYWTSWVPNPGDAQLSNAIVDYWVQFAKAGKPSTPGLPPWPAYRPGEPMAQELGSHVGQMPIPRGAKLSVFEETLEPQLRRKK
jgi:para-nitrobenzyl esterase